MLITKINRKDVLGPPPRRLGTRSTGCSDRAQPSWFPTVECTRDYVLAVPQIYVSGQAIVPPICDAFAWPTLNNVGPGESIGDIDSPVTGVRLTVTAGTGRAVLRMVPIGLRT